MTEQELKDKIVNTAISNVWKDCYGDEVVIDRAVAEQIADALIAAGLKFDVNYSFTAAFNNAQAERERDFERRLSAAEHRAEVAEKALKHAVNSYIVHWETASKKRWWYKYFLREAEKSLWRRGKND